MTSFESNSGRQFETDPVSGQIFYREPIDGSYSPWTPLEPSDYHPSQPATHNVNSSLCVSYTLTCDSSPQVFNFQTAHPAFHIQAVPPAPSYVPPHPLEQA